jgi:hypothetical protein
MSPTPTVWEQSSARSSVASLRRMGRPQSAPMESQSLPATKCLARPLVDYPARPLLADPYHSASHWSADCQRFFGGYMRREGEIEIGREREGLTTKNHL